MANVPHGGLGKMFALRNQFVHVAQAQLISESEIDLKLRLLWNAVVTDQIETI